MTNILQLARCLDRRSEPRLPSGIRIRTYLGQDDVARWLDLRRAAFAREKVGVGDWLTQDFEREFLAKPWWRPDRMWFAEFDPSGDQSLAAADRPVGTVAVGAITVGTVTLALRGQGPDAKPVVHWLAVRPAYRGRGIARALVAAVEQAAWDAGHRQVWLETHSGWTAASACYRALGYAEV